MLVYRCSAHGCCAPAQEHGAGGSSGRRFFTIDMHCHALSLEVERLVADAPQRRAEPEMMVRTLGEASARHNASQMLPAALPKLTQLELRLSDMDAMGVDQAVPGRGRGRRGVELEVKRGQAHAR